VEHEYKRRGHSWRVQSGGRNGEDFDEVVVVHGRSTGHRDSGLVLHAEAMGDNSWFIDVAGVCLWVYSGRDGIARVTGGEDRRPGRRAALPELRDPALDKKSVVRKRDGGRTKTKGRHRP
jgi:hypothetical protein